MSENHRNSPSGNNRGKGKKRNIEKEVYELLKIEPLSRRTAATRLGFTDQTYMVTQAVKNLVKNGRAEIVGIIRCERSGRKVEAVSTDANLFQSRKQLNIF